MADDSISISLYSLKKKKVGGGGGGGAVHNSPVVQDPKPLSWSRRRTQGTGRSES